MNNNFYIKYKNNTITYYPDRIFLYRNNDKRKLNNIEEFISIAKENKFYIYSPEDDCLENQIKLVSNCKILMCELGAGCCNMFFTNNKCKIIFLSFLKGWTNKYLFYNNGLLDRQIYVIEGKIITGNEHSCVWTCKINELKLKINELNINDNL